MNEEPKIDQVTGMPYYDHVPEGFRQATLADVKGGYFKNNAPFLLQSFHYENTYWPHRVKYMFNQAVMPWLEAGRLWIYKP